MGILGSFFRVLGLIWVPRGYFGGPWVVSEGLADGFGSPEVVLRVSGWFLGVPGVVFGYLGVVIGGPRPPMRRPSPV